MKTAKKCQIGTTIFDAGVDYETVISRAEREYKWENRCVECQASRDVKPLKRNGGGVLMCSDCQKELES